MTYKVSSNFDIPIFYKKEVKSETIEGFFLIKQSRMSSNLPPPSPPKVSAFTVPSAMFIATIGWS